MPFETALESFNNKKRKLKENHPEEITAIETEWECMWKTKKRLKSDLKLNLFLKNVYNNPPNYRLDASKAGMYCTNSRL